MKQFMKVLALLAVIAAFTPMAAFAATVTDKDVTRFTAAIPEVEKFNEVLKKSGHDKALEGAVQLKETDKTPNIHRDSDQYPAGIEGCQVRCQCDRGHAWDGDERRSGHHRAGPDVVDVPPDPDPDAAGDEQRDRERTGHRQA